MACKNCEMKPGKLIRSTADLKKCADCGRDLFQQENAPQSRWDTYFHSICKIIASKSPCLSRQIGAILVRDKSIISTGYNGPPRGVSHCGKDRFKNDIILRERFIFCEPAHSICPRRALNFKSGEGMQWCPAQHAEENCVSNAARNGVSTLGTTLYMNSIVPCQKCFGTLINAGIVEVVIEDKTNYDKHSTYIIEQSNISIRKFQL